MDGFFEITRDYQSCGLRPKSNYHTHNYLCGHAGGTVSDYVKVAVANGLDTIGVSDHCVPPIGTFEPYILTPETIGDLYSPQFDEAEKKYGDKIKILRAVEIEYFSGNDGYYKKLKQQLDYLVMGQHEYFNNGMRKDSFVHGTDEANVAAYCRNAIAGLRSGFFSLLAHPDLIFYRRPKITSGMAAEFERVIIEAKACNVALELNANGIRNHCFSYPTELLVTLCKKHNAKVVVSSDCHSPDEFCDEYFFRLYCYAKKQGLNVAEKLELK